MSRNALEITEPFSRQYTKLMHNFPVNLLGMVHRTRTEPENQGAQKCISNDFGMT